MRRDPQFLARLLPPRRIKASRWQHRPGISRGDAAAEAPFGGIKQSGFGREGGAHGIKDYLDVKYTHLAGV